MDRYLFYAYLNWYKNSQKSTFQKIMGLSIFEKIFFSIMFICWLVGSIFAFISDGHDMFYKIALSLYGATVIFCIIVSFYTDRLYSEKALNNFNEYKIYCSNLWKWLKDNFEFSNKEEIAEIRERILSNIEKMEETIQKTGERVENWLQTLAIPILLVIIAKFVDVAENVDVMINNVLSLIIIFAAIYSIVYSLVTFVNSCIKSKINKYQRLADDLQGIIDTNKYQHYFS